MIKVHYFYHCGDNDVFMVIVMFADGHYSFLFFVPTVEKKEKTRKKKKRKLLTHSLTHGQETINRL
jgi:hypothetical protein